LGPRSTTFTLPSPAPEGEAFGFACGRKGQHPMPTAAPAILGEHPVSDAMRATILE
jgi:hypothetical protein